MKIPSLVAPAATLALLGACSGAPVGLDPSAPSLELATTSTATTTTTTTTDSTSSTCTTSTTSDISDTSTTTSTTQLSASGTYAVAYGGALFIVDCTDSP